MQKNMTDKPDARTQTGKRPLRCFVMLDSAGPMIPCAVLLMLLSASLAFAQSPRTQLRQGIEHYLEERHEAAIREFTEAAGKAETEKLDPAIALFNKANAHYRRGDFEQALALYEEALRSDNLELNEAAHFNRGNALTALSERLEQEGQAETALGLLGQALQSYENTLTLNPADHEAKINHELVTLRMEQLQQQLMEEAPSEPEPDPEPEGDDPEQPDDPSRPEPDEEKEPEPPTDRPEDQPFPVEEDAVEAEWDELEDLSLEEAMMLLDALQEEEDVQREQMRRQPRRMEVEKDW